MNIKDLLFEDEELNAESLVQLHSGVIIDTEDMLVTQDGKTWRDAREHESVEVFTMLSKEKAISHETAQVSQSCSMDSDDGYHGQLRNVHIEYRADNYTEGVGIGFEL